MVARFIADLEPTLSATRLQRYRTPNGCDLDAIVNYFWNIAIAESLYCCLHAVEIALRNTLHATLSQHFGTPTWYDQRGLLDQEQHYQIVRAKADIQKRRDPVTPGRVVSALTFGFWVTILSRNYDSRLWRGNRAAPLRHAFPRVPKSQRQRVKIHRRYNDIREIRNSVFHYEPLFDDPDLPGLHLAIHEAIRWINPELLRTVELFDGFASVFTQRTRTRIEQDILAEIRKRYPTPRQPRPA